MSSNPCPSTSRAYIGRGTNFMLGELSIIIAHEMCVKQILTIYPQAYSFTIDQNVGEPGVDLTPKPYHGSATSQKSAIILCRYSG